MILFLLVGGFNTAFATVFILGLQWVIGEHATPQTVFALGSFICSIPSYLTMRIIVFRSHGDYIAEYIKYLLSLALNFIFSIFCLSILTMGLHINPYSAHCVAILCSMPVVYILLRFFTFRRLN